MKPDWSSKNVPAWAEWAAQEPSGSWYWYSHRPTYSELCTEWQTKGQREIIPKVELRAQDTLERRPDHCTSPAFIGKLRPGESVVIHSGEL